VAQPVNIPPTTRPLNTTPNNISVPLFGTYTDNASTYPNDCVQIDLFNLNSVYLESVARGTVLSISGTEVTLNPEKDLLTAGFISGKYNLTHRFLRNFLGSSDGHKLTIQEISNDRLEIRVVPFLANNISSAEFTNFFASGLFQQQKSIVLPDLYIYLDATDRVGVFDYIQDNLTISESPYSIIFKLTTPLPSDKVVGDLIWLSQEVSNPIQDTVTIIPPKLRRKNTLIAGPNFDVLVKQRTNQQTAFKNWNDLITTSSVNIQSIVSQVLSGSLIEGIPLNVDYRSFDNYVFFGSAKERLLNFKYKVQLLESYDARIAQLSTDLTGLSSANSTSSFYYIKNVTEAKNKKTALIGTFDGYEKYLYYSSHSYETSSYGEFYPATWPKQNNEKPYVLYNSTSSQAEDWFEGIVASASLYDYNNANNLQKLIPEHIQLDDSNESYLLFVNMIGHYYDLIYAYIKDYVKIYNRDESLLEGFSKDLIYAISQNLGIDFENGASIEDLWQYAIGVDSTGSYVSNFKVSSEDRVKETWKRVVANLPYLLKTKGTERSIRALINCYGLPATILRIREYGGPEPEFTTKTDLKYERFFYGLEVGQTSGSGFSYLTSPWTSSIETNTHPNTIEFRFKIPANDTREQLILDSPGRFHIKAFQSGSGDYIGFFLRGGSPLQWASSSVSCSVFDGNFHWLTLNRSTDNDTITTDQTYKLIVKKTNYEKVVQTVSCSIFVEGATSGSYNQRYLSKGDGTPLYLPGSGSGVLNTNYFQGTVQELRYWTKPLEDSVISNHALAPTSFQGDLDSTFSGSTSSFYHLIYRQTLGSDNKKYDLSTTSSIASKHPNQNIQLLNGSLTKSASFYNFISTASNYFEPIIENHSLEWPDLGGNRSVSNKIRIEPTITAGSSLYTNRTIQRSLTDSQPPDSPRLGVYLSPQNEINQDIAEQFGGISIDDYIGDPQDVYREYYPDLANLSNEYYKKYTAHNLYNNYIRIIRHYDSSLFQLIKKLVPQRANLQTGLVIEPTILERSKFATNKPVVEDLLLTSSLDIPDTYTIGGAVQDADGDKRDQGDYVWQTEIDMPQTELTASYQYLEGELSGSALTIQVYQNQYNNQQVEQQLLSDERLDDTIDLGVSGYGRDVRVDGSQYEFYTWNRIPGPTQSISPPINAWVTGSSTSPAGATLNFTNSAWVYNSNADNTTRFYIINNAQLQPNTYWVRVTATISGNPAVLSSGRFDQTTPTSNEIFPAANTSVITLNPSTNTLTTVLSITTTNTYPRLGIEIRSPGGTGVVLSISELTVWNSEWEARGGFRYQYVPSVRYDYSEGVHPTIYDSKLSEYQRVINNNLPPGVVILPNGTAYYDFISGDI
jgi:hypothetical protein